MKNRRDFLKGVVAAGTASTLAAQSQAPGPVPGEQASNTVSALPPTRRMEAMEYDIPEGYTEEQARHYFVQSAASDFMTDVIKKLDIQYIASNPGSSHRGFQESLVNYGGNRNPEWITCCHEESSVAMGHGYCKIAYRPMAMACHGTVGLQHASMAIYNAYCDRAPMIIFAGNHLDAADRRPGAEWSHSVQDAAKLVRDFVKWDDLPTSPTHFMDSLMRAYKIATTPPMGPVVIVLDGHLQEQELADPPPIPDFTPTEPPQGEEGALREAARLLVNAERPVILADRVAHTPEGMERLVALAEALQAPVVDEGGRMNFPNDHYLSQSGLQGRLIREADVILGLEMYDFWGSVNRMRDLVERQAVRVARPDAKLISLGVNDLFIKANYQSFQRFQPVDLSIAGDAQASLPALTEAVRRAMSSQRQAQIARRGAALKEAHASMMEQARKSAAFGWDASPVSTSRLAMEVWNQIRSRDWSLVSQTLAQWPRRLWTMNRHYHYIGGSGGAGVGYGAPASVGAALANRDRGRLTVSFQADGDMMYAPGVLWTAAHHNIPVLSIMHNNRAYHQEVMHLQRVATRRNRGADGSARVGNTLENPNIDFATLAKSLGVWSTGPIERPADLAPALKRAVEVVERGEPALVDVVCQPR